MAGGPAVGRGRVAVQAVALLTFAATLVGTDSPAAAANPGDLDPAFGGDGIAGFELAGAVFQPRRRSRRSSAAGRAAPPRARRPRSAWSSGHRTPRVAATSSNPRLLPDAGLVVSGAGRDRRLVLTPAPGRQGRATVTVTAAAPSGGATASATLTVIVGGDRTDLLAGGRGDDVVLARGGADLVAGAGGNDLLCGGAGHDLLLGGPGDDALFGQGGNDVLIGGPGRDVLDGGPGRNWRVDP